MSDTHAIDSLVQILSKLPALGPRSARRAVLYLLKKKTTHMASLIEALKDVYDNVQPCPMCGNMDSQTPCHICTDSKRDETQLCIVQDVSDLWALERAHIYRGRYHVLGGVLSALDGIGPDELNLSGLLSKVKEQKIKEVILALPATLDGQTTAHYIAELLAETGVLVSGLSRGVPVGGELDYLDDGTLQMAFKTRQTLQELK